MKQLDGPGSMFAFCVILTAAQLAECMPVAFTLFGIAMLGCAWDILPKRKKKTAHDADTSRAATAKSQTNSPSL